MIIGFQGVRGAYSEVALLEAFGKEVKPKGYELSEEVFEALNAGKIDCAFLPVENSIVGNVSVNLDLINLHEIFIICEHYLAINHCLMAQKGMELKKIEKVFSHPIALAQCREFINKNKLKQTPTFDTAGAAKGLNLKSSDALHPEGVIGPSLCAKIYDLEILEKNIQSVKNNITRFVGIVKKDKIPKDIKQQKTSISFCTKHHPGALLNCLQKFADHDINLTKLESRPVQQNPFKYTFFTDFVGSIADENIINCLEELKEDADPIKILGSYPLKGL